MILNNEKPYTKEEREVLDSLIDGAIEAEEIFTLEELEKNYKNN